jgi:hypothetical protein
MSEWQPIDTVPMDGSRVLALWLGKGTDEFPAMELVFWNAQRQALSAGHGGWGCDYWRPGDIGCALSGGWPTHWMAIPKPPVP